MKFKRLGRTDIEVSEICLGTMTWGKQNTEEDAHAQIDYALDAGLNFIDTAEMYAVPPSPETYGKTETYIGSWFRKTGKRDKWILASKIAGGGSRRPWIRDGSFPSRKTLRIALDDSLKRLQTDYIDLYQIHWPARGHYHFENYWKYDPSKQDTQAALDNILEVLQTAGDLISEGKIRHIGLSNDTAWGIMQYVRLAEQHDLPRIVSIQNEYSLLRRSFDHDLAEIAHHEQVGLLAYSGLASGALSGKYIGGALPEGSRGALSGGLYRHNEFSEPAIRAYIDLAERHGLDVCQMALAFGLSRPFTTAVIVGATTLDQLRTDIGAAEITLSDEVRQEIEAIHRRYPRTI